MHSSLAIVIVTCGLAAVAVSGAAPRVEHAALQELSLERSAPELYDALIDLERAQGMLFGALVTGNGKVDEAAVLRRMTRQMSAADRDARDERAAEEGYAALGRSGAGIIRRAHAFHRDVAAVFAAVPAADRKAALDALVDRYRGGPSLPDAPKDMTIIYDHPYSSFVPPVPPEREPRRVLAYPRLTGFMWSAHWYELAVLEPLESFDLPGERARGLNTVLDRLRRKLSGGTPPDGFPTELPLAPAIAPGLALTHDRAAAIVDNLNMLLEVITDVLVHDGVSNRAAAVDDVIRQFTDREYRCVQTDEWMVVALRHSIFAQGGPALATMTTYERNSFSGNHGQHYGPRRAPPPCD